MVHQFLAELWRNFIDDGKSWWTWWLLSTSGLAGRTHAVEFVASRNNRRDYNISFTFEMLCLCHAHPQLPTNLLALSSGVPLQGPGFFEVPVAKVNSGSCPWNYWRRSPQRSHEFIAVAGIDFPVFSTHLSWDDTT